MADSDSGTHISDTTEGNQEENEPKPEERLEPITESNSVPTQKDLQPQNELVKPAEAEIIRQNPTKEIRKVVETSPRSSLTSHITETTETTGLSQPRPSRNDERPMSMEHRQQRSHSRSHSRGQMNNHVSNQVSNHRSDHTRNHVTTAHVHSAPRVYRKLNGDIPPRRHVRRQRSLPPQMPYNGHAIGLNRMDGRVMHRSLESLQPHSHGGARNAYEFMEANRHQYKKPKSKQVDIMDVELDERGEKIESDDDIDSTPWSPTGIYAVFVITLWTGVLKLIDSIDRNGPVICTEGEEVRLWICAGCLSLIFCLAEITWKRKSLSKACFGTVLVFAYMIVGHTEPLSCRLGEGKVHEISKWQAAINFFYGALLGARVYQDIAQSIRERKSAGSSRRKRRRRKKPDDDSSDDSEAMRVYRI